MDLYNDLRKTLEVWDRHHDVELFERNDLFFRNIFNVNETIENIKFCLKHFDTFYPDKNVGTEHLGTWVPDNPPYVEDKVNFMVDFLFPKSQL